MAPCTNPKPAGARAGPAGADDRLGGAVTRADDQVVLIEIELFDDCGKQRKAMAIEPGHSGELLKHGGLWTQPFDGRRHAARDMEQGEQIGGRIRLAQQLEDLLAAAHAGKPIVNEGHPHDASTSP